MWRRKFSCACCYALYTTTKENMFIRLIDKICESKLYFRLFRKNKVRRRIEGSCKMRGNCCQNLILFKSGAPVSSEQTFKRLSAIYPEYAMFNPTGEETEEGYLRYSCTNLGADRKCGIYETRPEMCRNYPDPRMAEYGCGVLPGCGFKIVPVKSFESILNKHEQ